MPLEDHYRRVNTPLRRVTARERNVVITVVAVTLVALAALVLATAGDNRSTTTAPGCIHVIVAGRTGGEVVKGCGAEARETCARNAKYDDPRALEVAESCREAGIG